MKRSATTNLRKFRGLAAFTDWVREYLTRFRWRGARFGATQPGVSLPWGDISIRITAGFSLVRGISLSIIRRLPSVRLGHRWPMFPGLGAVIGATVVFFVGLGALVVLLPVALAYVALRVQDARETTPDPKLGLKLAFHAVHTTAILIILTGLSIFTIDLMEGGFGGGNRPNPFAAQGPRPRDDGLNSAQRTAVAMVGSGVLFAVVFWAFLLGTNDAEQRSVRRVFGGGRMALCLIITLFSITGLIVVLAQKEPQHELTEYLVGLILVWIPAGIIHMLLFFNNINRKSKTRRIDHEDERWRPER